MKNLIKVALVAAGIFSFASSEAQVVKKVAHGTAHVAASGAAAVTDKRYRGKMGPNGQTIYINRYSHYFYVNKRGKRVYLKKSQLLDKPRS